MTQIENYKIIPIGRCKDLSNQQFGDYKVLVIEEKFPFPKEEHARWLYTAVTRAASRLVLVRP